MCSNEVERVHLNLTAPTAARSLTKPLCTPTFSATLRWKSGSAAGRKFVVPQESDHGQSVTDAMGGLVHDHGRTHERGSHLRDGICDRCCLTSRFDPIVNEQNPVFGSKNTSNGELHPPTPPVRLRLHSNQIFWPREARLSRCKEPDPQRCGAERTEDEATRLG